MRKSNIKQLLKQGIGSNSSDINQIATHDSLYRNYEKNLFKSHAVPKKSEA